MVLLRQLPAVDSLLLLPETEALSERYGRELTKQALRSVLEEQRRAIRAGAAAEPLADSSLVSATGRLLARWLTPTLRPVINATGVIVHTNLGRAPLGEAALQAIAAVGAGYSTLEYDVNRGKRGSRSVHAEDVIRRATGAEAALVVNNNAAALLLMLSGLCSGREVVIGRSQLIEIGGGFRIPDILRQSGARLVEVGTTNKTYLKDYADAIGEETAAILVAHQSNFKIVGFTSEPSLASLAGLAAERGCYLLYDQGSGALADVTEYGLDHEPTVQEGLESGADLVTFSGDKLVGGPQAGILCGRRELVDRLKSHPLARALRADKLCLAALAAALNHFVSGTYTESLPVWRMLSRPLAEIEAEAEEWLLRLGRQGVMAMICDGRSTVGGGSLPGTSLPTRLVCIETTGPTAAAAALRQWATPVVCRVQQDSVLVDPRTVLPDQVEALMAALVACCGREARSEA